MTQKLTIADIQAQVNQIAEDWNAKGDDEKTHAAIDKLQIDTLQAIATAPTRTTKAELSEMAKLVLTLEVEGLDRWYA